jgi:hypothetical protein
MIEINELYIVQALEKKMAGVIKDIRPLMVIDLCQKFFISHTIVEIFPGV